MKGLSKGAREIAFGDFGLVAMEPCWLTGQVIESMRSTLARHLKKKGKLYLRVFSDHPVSKKPAETRMGKGKGAVEHWVAEVKTGRIMYEITGVAEKVAVQALELASAKLPIKTKIVVRSASLI